MRIKEGISPVAVANYLLEKDAKSACAGMDQMKLIKLVYICHGLHLAEFGKPLVNELAEAWEYGPIFPSIYGETMGSGKDPIKGPLGNGAVSDQLTNQQKKLADEVYEDYCKFDGIHMMLRAINRGTPWHTTYIVRGRKKFPIPNGLTKAYYKEMLDARYT